ncbi:MAG: hypothetical protein HY348_04520 [Nitrospira defluvii]|nr:hypothetical protein [Nitrospira defluvii]
MRPLGSMGVLLALGLSVACTTISAPPLQTPYFSGDVNDSKVLQGVIRKESQLAVKCASKPICDHVFFTRALAALYESRESAIHYFEKVIAVAPKGQLAASSRLWLQLLQTGEVPPDESWLRSVLTGPATARTQALLSQTIERTVHDLLDRELTIQQLRAMQDSESQSLEALQRELQDQERKAELFNSRREGPRMSVEPATLQNLQRQISDRDKKVEELTNQLEALKRIDQEMRGKTRPIKPPSNILPPQLSEPPKP